MLQMKLASWEWVSGLTGILGSRNGRTGTSAQVENGRWARDVKYGAELSCPIATRAACGLEMAIEFEKLADGEDEWQPAGAHQESAKGDLSCFRRRKSREIGFEYACRASDRSHSRFRSTRTRQPDWFRAMWGLPSSLNH